VLFGAAGVGKTSIMRYFLGTPLQQEMNQGFGIRVSLIIIMWRSKLLSAEMMANFTIQIQWL